MSGLSVLERAPSVNGAGKRPANKPKTRAKQPRGMKHARRLAYAVGAVGVGVLGLSARSPARDGNLQVGTLRDRSPIASRNRLASEPAAGPTLLETINGP